MKLQNKIEKQKRWNIITLLLYVFIYLYEFNFISLHHDM